MSDADEGSAPEAVPLAKTKVLSAADTDKVLARMPPLKGDPSDEQSFALRDKSVPAPRPGMMFPELGMTDEELHREEHDPNGRWVTADEVTARLRELRERA